MMSMNFTSCYMQTMLLYTSGTMNVVLSAEHKKEIMRYIYNHQVLRKLVVYRLCWFHNSPTKLI